MPSQWDEPLGLTVLEGMASGLPTITTRRGGIPEVAGDAAYYFDPPDTDQLARHLACLLDVNDRMEWARHARSQAEVFAWHHRYGAMKEHLLT